MRKLLALLVVASLVISSCGLMGKRVNGSGRVTTENREISGFTSIDVSGSIDVYVRNDSSSSVKVETDDNLHDLIEIREEGGVLHIHPRKGYNLKPTDAVKVYVSAPDFRRFEASGACDIYSENLLAASGSVDIDLSGSCDASIELHAPKVSVDISGSGSVMLKGETRDLKVDGTGSSTFKCAELKAENVEVDITGSGSADVYASVRLQVDVTGSGSVTYRGNASVSQSVSGSGSVKKVD